AGRRHPVEAGGTTADDDQIIRLWLVTHRDPRQSSWVSRIACKEYSRPRRPSVSPNAVELAIILFVEGIWGSLSPRNFARPVLFSCFWSIGSGSPGGPDSRPRNLLLSLLMDDHVAGPLLESCKRLRR